MRLTSTALSRFIRNLPKAYIEKAQQTVPEKVLDRRFGAPPVKIYRKQNPEEYVHTEDRPWELSAKLDNREAYQKWKKLKPSERGRYTPEDFPIVVGDRVEVLVGKDKGKQGLVSYVVEERNWVFVEGLNFKYKYHAANPSLDFPGLMQVDEQPLDVDKDVALVDPSDQKPTTIKWRYDEVGQRVRVSVRTSRVIDIPVATELCYEYGTVQEYVELPCDTKAADVKEKTYKPVLMTFEQDVMSEMNIKETRIPKKTYWY